MRFTVLALFLFAFLVSSSSLSTASATSGDVSVSVSVSGLRSHHHGHGAAADQDEDDDADFDLDEATNPNKKSSKVASVVNRGKEKLQKVATNARNKLAIPDRRNAVQPGSAEPGVAALREKFASRAWANANRVSIHLCGRYVCKAINDAFNELRSSKRLNCANAYQLGPNLEAVGFKNVGSDQASAQNGDVIVIHRFGRHIFGHVAIKTPNGWASDFKQRSWNPYSATPPRYAIYRYDP